MADGKKYICVYPGCNEGPLTTGGYLERVNPKGEPFEGACPDHYAAVIADETGAQPDEVMEKVKQMKESFGGDLPEFVLGMDNAEFAVALRRVVHWGRVHPGFSAWVVEAADRIEQQAAALDIQPDKEG